MYVLVLYNHTDHPYRTQEFVMVFSLLCSKIQLSTSTTREIKRSEQDLISNCLACLSFQGGGGSIISIGTVVVFVDIQNHGGDRYIRRIKSRLASSLTSDYL